MIEQRRVAEALFAARERAEVTLNSIGDAVLSTDLAGNVTYLNLAAEAMTGWSREAAAGRPDGQLAFLRAQQCPEAQGNLFSPPVGAERLGALLVTGVGRLSLVVTGSRGE